MPDHRSRDKVAVTVYLPRDLKASVKARTEQRGETVTDVILRAFRRYVR